MGIQPPQQSIDSIPQELGEIFGIFSLVGLAMGLSGIVATTQLGGGNQLIAGLATLVVITVAFLIGPVISLIVGLRRGETDLANKEKLVVTAAGTGGGYLVMMGIVIGVLLVGFSLSGDGTSSITGGQTTVGTGFSIETYITPIIAVAVPSLIAGTGGHLLVGIRNASNPRQVIPWRVVVSVILVSGVVLGGVFTIPDILSNDPQVEVDGSVSVSGTSLNADATVNNPTGQSVSNTMRVDMIVDSTVIASESQSFDVEGNTATNVSIELVTVEDLDTSQITAIQQGNFELQYQINNQTVETYPQ
ncbi:MAG: hypothetical protein J07HQX50_01313 [Haloquadratum sp. J07HQX50]|jgi:hypothetical protein|nr:MAG: hypothetical protein J07HQX50_01313 [Haloquadratum sp. J07HQX50]